MSMEIVARILGIGAEIAQNKTSSLKIWIFVCRDPSHGEFKLGLSAVVLLVTAHALTNLLGGCVCVQSKEELNWALTNKQQATASLIFSWILVVVAFSLLLMGVMLNSKTRRSCGLAHHRQLSIGGVLCFVHGLFCVAYFMSASASREEEKMGRQSGGPV